MHITLGRSIFKIEPYYPNLLKCFKCCRIGHSSAACNGQITCSSCGGRGHKHDVCEAEAMQCISCGGNHHAFHKSCPAFQKELAVCKISSLQNIFFSEARALLAETKNGEIAEILQQKYKSNFNHNFQKHTTNNNVTVPPDIPSPTQILHEMSLPSTSNRREFPSLPSTSNRYGKRSSFHTG